MNVHDFSIQDGSENELKLAQDRSKTAPKEILFMLNFGFNFGSFWAPFWFPFWNPLGLPYRPQIGIKNHPKLRCGNIPPQDRPEKPQDLPKTIPRGLKIALRGPHDAPEKPQDRPNPLKVIPGMPQDGAKRCNSSPQGAV